MQKTNSFWTLIILKETVQPHQMRNMPHAFAMIPMLIPDPAFIKRKVFLA